MNQRRFLFLLIVFSLGCNKAKKEEELKVKNQSTKTSSVSSMSKNLRWICDLAKQSLKNNKFDQSIYYADQLIIAAKEEDNKDAEAFGNYVKGYLYEIEKKQYDKSLEYYYASLQLRKTINDANGISNSLLGMCNSYYKLEFPDRAESYYNLAIDHAKKINDKSTEAAAYRGMGLVHQNLKNDYVVAALHYAKCLELQKELTNKEGIADAYHSLAGTYYLREDFKQAEVYYLKALEYRIANENSRLADTYFSLGLVHKELKNYTSAKLYFYKSLDVSERVSYSTLIVRSHMEFGIIAQLQKNYPTAIKELTIAQQLAEQDKSGNITLLADIADTFSKLYEEMGDDSKAMDYVHKKEAWQNIAKAEREQITKLLEKQRFDTVKWEDTVEKKKEEGISMWWYIISAIVISFVIGGGSVLTWTYITTKTGRAPVKKEEEKQESTSEYKEEGIDQIKPGNSIQVVETVNEDGEDDTDPIKALMNRLYRILLHQFHTNEWIEKESMQVYTEAKEMEKAYKSKPDASLYRNELKDIRYIVRNSKWFLVCLKEQDKTKKKLD